MSDYQAALKEYVEQAKASGMGYDEVRQGLIDGGWDASMVDQMLPEAFGGPAPAEAPAAAPPAAEPPKEAAPPAYTPPAAAPVTPAYQPPVAPAGTVPPAYPASGGYGGSGEEGLGAWLSKGWAMVTSETGTFMLAAFLAGLVSLTVVCAPPMIIGLYRMFLKKYDGKPIATGDIFEGFQFFAKSWGAFLLLFIASGVVSGTLSAILVHGGHPSESQQFIIQGVSGVWGLIVGTFSLFMWPLIADEREGVLGALSVSVSTALSNFVILLIFVFLCQLLASVGILLCCVGALFTGPVASCAMVACYRSYFPARA